MEDLTQKSSLSVLSPTQQNSDSAYEQFKLPIQNAMHQEPPIHEMEESSAVDAALDSPAKNHSAFTDSTAHTYGEDETGHVQFDTIVPEDDAELEENLSQDASFAPRDDTLYAQEHESHHEPQTPAPPLNPFSHRGSVMKGFEMFEATQPSSIGRHLTSAISASSRPSPNVYDDFTSPAKRMASSPLAGRVDTDNTPPLQSSVRDLLRSRSNDSVLPQHVQIFRTSGVQSFDAGQRIQPQNSIREPRPYVSMQESQELRRRELESLSPVSGSDTDFSDLDDVPQRQLLKRKREQEIRKELSGIEVRKRPASSGRVAASSPEVVVPSTGRKGRRRSIQEDYVAQCEGRDARDTQQDDVIVDSQSEILEKDANKIPAGPSDHIPPWTDSLATDRSNLQLSPTSSPQRVAEPLESSDTVLNANVEQPSSATNNIDLPQPEPSLPLQEVSTNRNDARTPMGNKTNTYSDAANSTVPETSPAEEDRLRPMGEIASISFGETQFDPLDVPGFSQDVDFEDAIRLRSSPDPTPRKRRAPRLPLFPGPAEGAFEEPRAISLPETTEESLLQPSMLAPPVANEENATRMVDDGNIQDNDEGLSDGEREEEGKVNEPLEVAEPKLPKLPRVAPKRGGLRTKEELKGPSRALRRTETKPLKTYLTPRQSTRVTKSSSTTTTGSIRHKATPDIMSTPLSSLPTLPSSSATSTPTRSSARQRAKASSVGVQTPAKPPGTQRRNSSVPTVTSVLVPKPTKRKSFAAEGSVPTRSSKRQMIPKSGRDGSIDPLTGPSPFVADASLLRGPVALFTDMAFAVSYVKQLAEKDSITQLIKEGGGQILNDGFDCLFDPRSSEQDGDLALSSAATRITFTALIADEHSRKAKYMQALALNLPCISGRWVSACVSKGLVINWTPYLLCAGQSSLLGNAIRSRTLKPYPAIDAKFMETFRTRPKLLEGRSILLVTGKGRGAEDKRKAYVFLTRALGPARLDQVQDLEQARKRLLAAESEMENGSGKWDLLYVDTNEVAAESIVFGSTPRSTTSRKRKRGPVAADDVATPAPQKIRIISDEVVIQSLILGELLDSPIS
jgi:hypothetical protein